MKFNLLSSLLIAASVLFSMSCSNKAGNESGGTDSTSVKSTTSESTTGTSTKKYEIKSAIVTYTAEVMGMKTSQMLYFDDYGAKERQETITEMEMMGVKTRSVNVSLTKDGYKYDFETENVTNNENKLKKEIKKSKVMVSASSDMSKMAAEMSDQMKKEYEYKEEGTETVAGVTGTKFSMKIGKAKFTGVLYKKVMIKTEMDMMKITAQKFEENASVPADKFEYPKDYKIIELQ
jgi:hypothetical protein